MLKVEGDKILPGHLVRYRESGGVEMTYEVLAVAPAGVWLGRPRDGLVRGTGFFATFEALARKGKRGSKR